MGWGELGLICPKGPYREEGGRGAGKTRVGREGRGGALKGAGKGRKGLYIIR